MGQYRPDEDRDGTVLEMSTSSRAAACGQVKQNATPLAAFADQITAAPLACAGRRALRRSPPAGKATFLLFFALGPGPGSMRFWLRIAGIACFGVHLDRSS